MKILLVLLVLTSLTVSLEYHNFDFLELPGGAKAYEKFNQAMGGGKPNGRFGDAGFGGMDLKNNKSNTGIIPNSEFEKMKAKMNNIQAPLQSNYLNTAQKDKVVSQNNLNRQLPQLTKTQPQKNIPQSNQPSPQNLPAPKQEGNKNANGINEFNKSMQDLMNLSNNLEKNIPNQLNSQQNAQNQRENSKINGFNNQNIENKQPNPNKSNVLNQNYKQREQPPFPSSNLQGLRPNRPFPNMNNFNNQPRPSAPFRPNPTKFKRYTAPNNISSRVNNLRLRGNNPEELKRSFLNQIENLEEGPINADSETLFELSQLD